MEVFKMLDKQKILAFTMLFMILASNSCMVLGVSTMTSGELSGDILVTESGEVSGELPDVIPDTGTSGEISGEISGESYLNSVAQSSSISTWHPHTQKAAVLNQAPKSVFFVRPLFALPLYCFLVTFLPCYLINTSKLLLIRTPISSCSVCTSSQIIPPAPC